MLFGDLFHSKLKIGRLSLIFKVFNNNRINTLVIKIKRLHIAHYNKEKIKADYIVIT